MDQNFRTFNEDLNDLLNSDNGCEYIDLDLPLANLSPCSDGNKLNILHINIRSLVKNLDYLLLLLNDQREKNIIVHLIGICETMLTDQSAQLINLENYKCINVLRKERPGGGISILVHDSIMLKKVIPTPFNDSFESCGIEVKYQGREIFMSEFYRIPNSPDLEFKTALNSLISISQPYQNQFMCSDQNYDLIKTHLHKPTSDFLQMINENRFITAITKPTRVTHQSSTLIDNIFIGCKTLHSFSSYVITDSMSDNYPCLVSYSINNPIWVADMLIEKRKLTEEAIKRIQQDLLFLDWTPMRSMTTNDVYNFFITKTTEVLDFHAPQKIIKLRMCDKFREPWLSVQIKKFNTKCRKLCNKARKTGFASDHQKYKIYRNIVNQIKNYEKRKFYNDLFAKIGKNSKLIWNVMNNLIRSSNSKHEITEILSNEKKYTSETDICRIFNDHFIEAGIRTQSSVIPAKPGSKLVVDYVKRVDTSKELGHVTEGQICKIVQKMKPKKSFGFDEISNFLLKQLINIIKTPLCMIFNKSIMNGDFPDLMKIAKMIPCIKADKMICWTITARSHCFQ